VDRISFKLLVIPLLLFQTACSSLYFAYQAGRGQLRLLNRARPIEQVIQDPYTAPDLVQLLKRVEKIKKYGESRGLKPTSHYQDYVQLDQDAVVYVVTISDPFQLKAKIFKFPIVGSFNYIGWFNEADANEFAEPYRQQDMDVDVRGASAYSTLGWFKDPLLSSMIPFENGRIETGAVASLVNVILHESVHATLFIPDQTYFNEGLASFIADRLTEQLLQSDVDLKVEYDHYKKTVALREKIHPFLVQRTQKLKALYDSFTADMTLEKKKLEKSNFMKQLNSDYSDLLFSSGSKRRSSKIWNNASLIQFLTYQSSDSIFEKIYQQQGQAVDQFLKYFSNLKSEDFGKPNQEDLSFLIR
jgi:predicted aminopeptidase